MKWFSGLFKQCIDVNRFPLKKNFTRGSDFIVSFYLSVSEVEMYFLYLQRQAASRSIAIGQEHL